MAEDQGQLQEDFNQYGVPPVLEPRQVVYATSYANAHAAQRLAGRPETGANRAPQSLPTKSHKQSRAQSAQQQGDAAEETKQEKPAPKVKISGKALVKAVPQGDTLVLIGNAAGPGQVPPERTVVLSGIAAPRLARSKKNQDEPFAWQSREYLRNLVLGKVVSFTINHTDEKSGREYAQVKLDELNVGEAVVGAGWATAKVAPSKRPDQPLHPERQALVDAQTQAEAGGLGIHNKKATPKETVRTVDWTPDPKALHDKLRGQRVNGILDYVRDGSTYRIELLDPKGGVNHAMIQLLLAGVQAPKTPLPENLRRDGDSSEPEPYALQARDFVEQRLLHREVGVFIQGIDKLGNLYGSLDFPRGNISVELLKNGLAKTVKWTAGLTTNAAELTAAEELAKGQKLNIWRDHQHQAQQQHKPAAAGGQGSVNDQDFTGKVVQVVSGDTVVVQDNNGNTKRFYLASVQAPRLGNPRSNAADEPWSWEAKDYLRKKLIGKKVRVIVEYTRGGPGGQQQGGETRTFVTLQSGNKNQNVAEQLVLEGLANVAKHRIDDPRANDYDALLAAEDKARAAKRNIHSEQKPPQRSMVDLTERFIRGPRGAKPTDENKGEEKTDKQKADEEAQAKQTAVSAKAKQFLAFLQKDKNLRATVEHVFSGTRLKLSVPKHNCMIFFALAGVRAPNPPARGKDNKPQDNSGDAALNFIRENFMQHDVKIDVETMDKGDNFIGALYDGNNQNVALQLVEQGMVAVYEPSANRTPYGPQLIEAETRAKANKIGIWKNWVPPPPPEEKPVEAAAAANGAETEEKEIKENERLINIRVTEIVDPTNFYAHIVGDKAVELVESRMHQLSESNAPVNPYQAEKGAVCAALFHDGNYHRVRVETKTPEGDYKVLFIDYGNSETVPASALRALDDQQLKKLGPVAKQCTLAGIKGPAKTSEHYEEAVAAFTEFAADRDLLAKVEYREPGGRLHLSLHDADSPDSLNTLLLRDGLARIPNRPERRLKQMIEEKLRPLEEEAKNNRYSIWEYGDVSDDEEEATETRGGPRRGGPRGAGGRGGKDAGTGKRQGPL